MVPFELDSIAKFASAKSDHSWLETIAITAIFFAAGIATHPQDPLMAEQTFPWSLFAIILIGMRYGSAEAFACAVGLHIALGVYAISTGLPVWPLPLTFSLGLFISALLIGEFRDAWEQDSEKLARSNEYRQARLEEFTHSYHVLKISHDALEQENAGRRNSLRSAMLTARSALQDAKPDTIGNTLLDLLATYIAVRSASYHPISTKNGVTNLAIHSIASIGGPKELQVDDPMLKKALETRVTTSVRPEQIESLASRGVGDAIAYLPVVDAYQRLHGVVSITQIPFFSLTERNLQLGSIITSRFADCLRASERLQESEGASPDDLERFDDELYWFCYQALRCLDQASNYGMEGHLLLHRFANPKDAPLYVSTVQAQTRGLDVSLAYQNETETEFLLMLLPLTNKSGVSQFMNRFGDYIESAHSIDLLSAGIDTHRLRLSRRSTQNDIVNFINRFVGEPNQITTTLSSGQTNSRDDANNTGGGADVRVSA